MCIVQIKVSLCVLVEGASTALLGKEGAMACTVAVEESISEHYNNQIRTLMEVDPERYEELLQVGDTPLKLTLHSTNMLINREISVFHQDCLYL